MKTEKFESVVNELSIQKCLEYSDKPDELKTLIDSLLIEVKFTGIKKHFADDKEERLTGIFKISKGNLSIEFDFGFSGYDTAYHLINSQFDLNSYDSRKKIYQMSGVDVTKFNMGEISRKKKEFKTGLLYNCLTCCKSEYYTPIDFDDFCSEFGYDNDSIKAKNTWENCLKQSSKLQRIFTESEIEILPS